MHEIREMTDANKRGWDQLAAVHYEHYHIDTLKRGTPLINGIIRDEVGDVSGKSLIHLLCHIGTDTISWALLGASVAGVDISSEAVRYARTLADELGIQATFIESDIMDAAALVNGTYDIAFCSTGVLCWIPDVVAFARTAFGLLNEGGFFYIFDGHPFQSVLYGNDDTVSEDTIVGDYFRRKVWQYDNMGDYTVADLKFPTPSFEWHWKLGDVITAFCDAGFRIEFVHEFPRYFYSGYTPAWGESEEVQRYPCTFSMKATKGAI